MQYVMVPVPEEHVAEVQRYVTWGPLLKVMEEGTDPAIVGEIVGRADPVALSLLIELALAAENGETVTLAEASRRLDRPVRELVGVVSELNDQSVALGGPKFFVPMEERDAEGPEAGSFGERRVVGLVERTAHHVLEATGVGSLKSPSPAAE